MIPLIFICNLRLANAVKLSYAVAAGIRTHVCTHPGARRDPHKVHEAALVAARQRWIKERTSARCVWNSVTIHCDKIARDEYLLEVCV